MVDPRPDASAQNTDVRDQISGQIPDVELYLSTGQPIQGEATHARPLDAPNDRLSIDLFEIFDAERKVRRGSSRSTP